MIKLPLAYRMPLTGTTLIEASAGTGKTYTLVRLMARHILWHGCAIEQVLAVTFTNAAASELKQRLRGFLAQTADWLAQPCIDGDIEHLFEQRPADVAEGAFAQRLQNALANQDRAAVYTIHGFCQILLQRHALAFEQAIPAPKLLENESALRQRVCEEFWRMASTDARDAAALNSEFKTPEKMAGLLSELLSPTELMPPMPAASAPLDGAGAVQMLQASYAEHGAEALQEMLRAYQQQALHGNQFRNEQSIRNDFAQLALYLQMPGNGVPPVFGRIAFSAIREKKNHSKPNNPLLHALDVWNRYAEAHAEQQLARQLALYHGLKTFAGKRLQVLKKEQSALGFDDIIDVVYRAFERGDAHILTEIRRAWPAALVDEFQDTDHRQWRIFEHLYEPGSDASLTLIGDPKQAIYSFRGGDIHTYLAVQALCPQREHLTANFRSNQAVLDGIESVFVGQHAQPFLHPSIEFTHIQAGRPGPELRIGGHALPAVALLDVSNRALDTPQNIAQARHKAANASAEAIAELLMHARYGRAHIHEHGNERALRSDDIVVLVSKHSEALLMQSALQARAIDSVCVRRDNIFASYAALDVLAVLHYVLQPGARRIENTARAGLLLRSADLVGYTLDVIECAQRLQQHGALAALGPILAAANTVLVHQYDGERQRADYAQVLECLQAQFKATVEAEQCLEWLARQIEQEQPDDNQTAVQPYLQSSQARVRIMTLHQSKGLEFGFVFMPFTAIRQTQRPGFGRYFDGQTRCLHFKHKLADEPIQTLIENEHRAEALRLLYVGMTRAKFGLRVSWGAVKDFDKSALGYLLGSAIPASLPLLPAGNALSVLPSVVQSIGTPALPVPMPRVLHWQISSFSGWHQAKETIYRQPADDETAEPELYADADPFKGAAFGNAMHTVLEHARSDQWRPFKEAALGQCRDALVQFGYTPALAETGAPRLAVLVQACLLAVLPEQISLLDLPNNDKRHELEFHLRLEHADAQAVLAILQRFGYCQERARLGFQQQLNGLLTGKIDLLYRHNGQLFMVDYKSNSLPEYSAGALHEAMRRQEYDLQYVLYTVAMHRWLSLRLPGYEYASHFGGVRYLFARGLDATQPGAGLYCERPSAALITELAACFDGEASHD